MPTRSREWLILGIYLRQICVALIVIPSSVFGKCAFQSAQGNWIYRLIVLPALKQISKRKSAIKKLFILKIFKLFHQRHLCHFNLCKEIYAVFLSQSNKIDYPAKSAEYWRLDLTSGLPSIYISRWSGLYRTVKSIYCAKLVSIGSAIWTCYLLNFVLSLAHRIADKTSRRVLLLLIKKFGLRNAG